MSYILYIYLQPVRLGTLSSLICIRINSPVNRVKKWPNLELIATEFILTVLNLENATNCNIKNLKKSGVRRSEKSKMASKMASGRYKFQGQI